MSSNRSLAIVGAGPRGLSSLEHLCIQLSEQRQIENIQILHFEASDRFGYGPVYEFERNEDKVHLFTSPYPIKQYLQANIFFRRPASCSKALEYCFRCSKIARCKYADHFEAEELNLDMAVVYLQEP